MLYIGKLWSMINGKGHGVSVGKVGNVYPQKKTDLAIKQRGCHGICRQLDQL